MHLSRQIISLCLLVLVLASSCSTAYKNTVADAGTKTYNVSYGPHKKNKLDVYKPVNADSTKPVVVLIHGGSWKRGDKLMLRSVQNMLYKNGVASVNINYRLLSNKVSLPQQKEDIALSLLKADSIFNKTKEDKYILLGESAGAHLAMIYGYKNSDRVAKIISLSGPANLTDKAYTSTYKSWLAIPLFNKLTGSKFKKGSAIPESYMNESPLYNVSDVPTLLVQGKLDILVNKRNAYDMQQALTQRNIENKLVVCKFGGHVARLNPVYRNTLIYPAIKEWVGIKN